MNFVTFFTITVSRPGGFIQNVNIQYLVVIFNCLSLKIKLLATLIITCRYAELISDEIRNET